ncbi:reverse transcriptase domain-containing protein [Tanacetum coccineum]
MRTRSQARRRRQPQVRPPSVESPNLEKPNNNQETFNPPIVTMDDNRICACSKHPHGLRGDAIVVPDITSGEQFEIKTIKLAIHQLTIVDNILEYVSQPPQLTTTRECQLPTSDGAKPNSTSWFYYVMQKPSKQTRIGGIFQPKWGNNLNKCVGDTKTLSYNIIESVNRVDVIDIACEEYVQEVLEISESGNPTSTSGLTIDSHSPSFTPFGGSDFLMEEIDEFLEHDDSIPPGVDGIYDSEGDTVYLEELLSVINSDPNLPPSPVCEINVPEKVKSSCEDPPDLELKDLPSHLEYAFLEGDDKLPVIIAKNLKDEDKTALIKVLKSHKHAIAWKISDIKGIVDPSFAPIRILIEGKCQPVVQHREELTQIHEIPIDPLDQEKTTFTCPYGTFAYRRMPFGLCNAPGTFQRCMVAIFHDMIEKTMEVFMDDFSVFGDSFSSCLSHLDKMLQRCEDTNLVLNWENATLWSRKE